jgi:hypothetical protein
MARKRDQKRENKDWQKEERLRQESSASQSRFSFNVNSMAADEHKGRSEDIGRKHLSPLLSKTAMYHQIAKYIHNGFELKNGRQIWVENIRRDLSEKKKVFLSKEELDEMLDSLIQILPDWIYSYTNKEGQRTIRPKNDKF